MSAIESRSLSLSMRCYRRLLRAYPQSFLMEFEELLCQAFGDLAHRAVRSKGFRGLFVLWMRTIPDLISSAFSQRFQPNADWRFRLRWIAACAAGAVLGVALMFVVRLAIDKIQISTGTLVVPRSSQAMNYLILQFTASFGLVVGWFQSLAIGWKRAKRAAWVLATMFGAASTAGVLLLAPLIERYLQVTIHPFRLLLNDHRILYNSGMALLCLSLMGSLQALVLARRNVRFLAWIPISAIGVLTCGFVTVSTASQLLRYNHRIIPVLLIVGLIVGVLYGLLTVLPLEWILRQRESQDISGESLSQGERVLRSGR